MTTFFDLLEEYTIRHGTQQALPSLLDDVRAALLAGAQSPSEVVAAVQATLAEYDRPKEILGHTVHTSSEARPETCHIIVTYTLTPYYKDPYHL